MAQQQGRSWGSTSGAPFTYHTLRFASRERIILGVLSLLQQVEPWLTLVYIYIYIYIDACYCAAGGDIGDDHSILSCSGLKSRA